MPPANRGRASTSIWEIERPIVLDVHLGAVKNLNLRIPLTSQLQGFALLAQPLYTQTGGCLPVTESDR